MIKIMTAIEMALDRLDRSDKFNAGIYEKARDEYIELREEVASLRRDLDHAESVVDELTDKNTGLKELVDELLLK